MVRLSFVIRKRKTHKLLIISVFSQYDPTSRIISISLLVLFPIIYSFISKIEQQIINPRKSYDAIKSLLYSFALMTSISMKHSRNLSTRIVVSMILFYALIVSTLFQSTVVKNLNTNQEFGKINNIHQLISEGYTLKMPAYFAILFKNRRGLDKVTWMMNKTNQNYEDVAVFSNDFEKILPAGKKIAFLSGDLYVSNYLNQYYDDETGSNLFESVPETAFEFYIALMIQKNSNFIESFNKIISNYVESGIGGHHIGQAYRDNDKVWIERLKNGKVPKIPGREIKFTDLSLAFEILLYLHSISFAVFVVENICNRFRKK
jgi:hypothetical protein